MADNLAELAVQQRPTAARPLLGLTVLLVEDSRYSSDAIRLMCLRSGARIRRADCMASARRHLAVYRPSVAIVDLGLPDGSGLDLVEEMHRAGSRVPIILCTSGAEREAADRAARGAGADGFLPKPVASLAAFQASILEHLPEILRPQGPRDVTPSAVAPDPIALREDLSHALTLLEDATPPIGYLRRFLIGLARTAGDEGLERLAIAMDGGFAGRGKADLSALLARRIAALPVGI